MIVQVQNEEKNNGSLAIQQFLNCVFHSEQCFEYFNCSPPLGFPGRLVFWLVTDTSFSIISCVKKADDSL